MNLVNRYCFGNSKKTLITIKNKKNKEVSERKSRKIKHTHTCKNLMSSMHKQFVTITVLIDCGIYCTKTSYTDRVKSKPNRIFKKLYKEL